MKKFIKAVLICISVCCLALSFAACGEGGGTAAKTPGAHYKVVDGDKTLTSYVAEEGVTSFTVPNDVKKIRKNAFKGNGTLKEVVVGSNVTEIATGAFANMTALEKITLPFVGATKEAVNEKKTFGYVFGTESYDKGVSVTQNYNASSTATYYLPETLRTVVINAAEDYKLSAYAFYGMGRLNEIEVKGSVTAIGDYAFYNCYNIKKFVMPDTVTEVGAGAFIKCVRLNTTAGVTAGDCLKFSAALEKIGDKAFEGTKLTEITLPSGVKEIGKNAFASAVDSSLGITDESELKKITLPATLKKISDYAFLKCVNLTTVVYADGLEVIGVGAFGYCEKLDKFTTNANETESHVIRIAASVENVASGAFEFLGDTEYKLYNSSTKWNPNANDYWKNGSDIK